MTFASISRGAFTSVFFLVAAILLLISIPSSVHAATCAFTRNLELGMEGEDVRCLQKYLNGAGFVIATSGVGSPGRETTQFKDLTQKAVIAWQKANGLTPPIGYFGAQSRAKYSELTGGTPSTPSTETPSSSGSDLAANLLAQVAALQEKLKNMSATPTASVATEKTARTAIQKAIAMIRDAEEQIDDNGGAAEIQSARENYADAQDDLFEAVRQYFNSKWDEAIEAADDAYDNAEDAFEDAGGTTEEDEVDERLDELDQDIKDAWDTVDNADKDGDDIGDAEDLLEEAEDTLDEAWDAYDDDNFDEALELADEVEKLVRNALREIGKKGDDAEDALDDARDALDDAWDEVEAALDDGDDVGDAEDLLEEAEDLLNDAEDALDDNDEDEALDLIDEAEDLIDDALDEF
jgi:peptidoglycan hydrolase-like protein with peptidoglycan-binding domain/HEPN domain-containing protein